MSAMIRQEDLTPGAYWMLWTDWKKYPCVFDGRSLIYRVRRKGRPIGFFKRSS